MTDAEFSPVQIEEVALDAVHYERTEGTAGSRQETFSYELDLDIRALQDDNDPSAAVVRVEAAVVWEEEPGPFSLTLSYSAHIRHDGSLDDETFEAICRTRISSTLLSFARPFVARLMSEANESFRLPMIDLRNHPVRDDD